MGKDWSGAKKLFKEIAAFKRLVGTPIKERRPTQKKSNAEKFWILFHYYFFKTTTDLFFNVTIKSILYNVWFNHVTLGISAYAKFNIQELVLPLMFVEQFRTIKLS